MVIVAFRSLAPLARCLESLARASAAARLPIELVVVDNASNDGTVEWLAREHPSVTVIANQENLGFTRAVNQGVNASQADRAVLLLNPDCEILESRALPLLRDALIADPHFAAVAPTLIDGQGTAVRSAGRFPSLWALICDHLGLAQSFPDSPLFGRYKYGGRPLAALDRVDWASGAALLIRTEAWREIGGFDENIFMYMEEVDWCRRAARAGWAVKVVPAARIMHVGQQSSRQMARESYLHNLRSRVYYFRKHHGLLAAWIAKDILALSLGLKWLATRIRPRGIASARIYAAGLGAIWEA